MEQRRGILFLADPLRSGASKQKQIPNTISQTLIFDENGRYLSRSQTALWKLRRSCGWICVAAEGHAAAIAVALAAQLPVDRLAIWDGRLFLHEEIRIPRELLRLKRYARRNLALVISEILLINARDKEIRGMMAGMGQTRICAIHDSQDDLNLLLADWNRIDEKNLLIPGNCV